MSKKLLSRLSIRITAPVLLVLPLLLAAGVLIAIGTIQGKAAVERLASQLLAQIHDQISQHVESLVSMPSRLDQANLALIESGRLDPAEPRSWGPVLVEQFRAFEVLSAITWGAEDGQCTWIARYAGDEEHLYYAVKDKATGNEIVEYRVDQSGHIQSEPAGSFAFDPRLRPWYLAPKEAGAPAWSEPFLWVGGGDEDQATLGIAYGWPYFDDAGNLVGVIDADLSLQDISRFLSGLRIGRSGRAFLVDDQGLMLASSTGAALANKAGERLHAGKSEQDWIESSSHHLARTFGSVGSVNMDHEEIIEVNGQREWLRASPIEHGTGLNWVIVTLVPEADFMAEITAGRRRSAWFTAGVTLATLGLGVLLAMAMVRPIIGLSRHVRRLGEGDLEGEIHLPYARELVRLSDDINQMTADLRDRMRMRRSLALAMDVQKCLLPSETPSVKGLDIAGHSTYCDETGGDYYDYLDVADLSSSTAVVAVGDVVGHGVAAAMLMATARGVLRSRCEESGSLADLLTHMNAHLNRDVGVATGRFMTMLLMTVDAARKQLRWASAGHDAPLVYDAEEGRLIELDGGGFPLGVVAEEKYEEFMYSDVRPGQICFVGTDGVWEAANVDGELFGKKRVVDLIRRNSEQTAEHISSELRAALDAFRGEAKQEDDITFVILKVGELS